MECPYCNRRVGDMPDHLRKKPNCHKKHTEKLRRELQNILILDKKKGNNL